MRRTAVFTMWLLVTALAVFVANTAVTRVRSAVTDAPLPLGLPAIPTGETESTLDAVDRMGVAQSATSLPGSLETLDPPATNLVPSSSSSVPQPATGVGASTQTTPPAATAPGDYATYNTDGGWVTLRQVGEEVYFEAAGPKPGWQVIPESTGPESIAIKFKRPGEELTFKAEVENGVLETTVEE